MTLDVLLERIQYEDGSGLHKPVRLLSPNGETYDILSLNWDAENNQWVLVGEEADE
jgi:hypothetical protein